jgi:hypothetical protein
MKKIFRILAISLMILMLAGTSNATLISISDDIFFDDINNLYWYDNPGAFDTLSLAAQISQIDALNISVGADVFDSWTMANQDDVSLLVNYNYIGTNWLDVFDGTWQIEDLGDDRDWSLYANAQSSALKNGSDVRLRVDDLGGDWSLKYDDFTEVMGAWVVQRGAPNPVPEPSTIVLMCKSQKPTEQSVLLDGGALGGLFKQFFSTDFA